MDEFIKQWVCTDCIILLANGDVGDISEEREAELLSKFVGYHAMCGSDVDTYSTSPCDGCGGICHGERHEVFIQAIEPQHVDYPHEPGTLYDCPACEDNCYCDDMGLCLHCAIEAQEVRDMMSPTVQAEYECRKAAGFKN